MLSELIFSATLYFLKSVNNIRDRHYYYSPTYPTLIHSISCIRLGLASMTWPRSSLVLASMMWPRSSLVLASMMWPRSSLVLASNSLSSNTALWFSEPHWNTRWQSGLLLSVFCDPQQCMSVYLNNVSFQSITTFK